MRTTTYLALAFLFIFSACQKEDEIQLLDVISERVDNLYAPQSGGVNPRTGQFSPISGEFTKFKDSSIKAKWDDKRRVCKNMITSIAIIVHYT